MHKIFLHRLHSILAVISFLAVTLLPNQAEAYENASSGEGNIVFESSLEDFHFSTNTPLDSAISAARGNYGDAAVNAAAAIPGIGLGVGAGKLLRKGVQAVTRSSQNA